MIETYLSRKEIKTNLTEAFEYCDLELSNKDFNWLLKHNTPDSDIARWSVRNYIDFASDVANECGNVRYVAKEYGFDVEEED